MVHRILIKQNKNESDDEVLSDFSEDETANMDLE